MLNKRLLDSGSGLLCGISFQGRLRKQGGGFEAGQLKVSYAEGQQGEVTA